MPIFSEYKLEGMQMFNMYSVTNGKTALFVVASSEKDAAEIVMKKIHEERISEKSCTWKITEHQPGTVVTVNREGILS
jgi:hypothetical protein